MFILRFLHFNHLSSAQLQSSFLVQMHGHANGFTIFVSSLQVYKCFDGLAPGMKNQTTADQTLLHQKSGKKSFQKKNFLLLPPFNERNE